MTRVCPRHPKNDKAHKCPVCRAYREVALASRCISCDGPMFPTSSGKRQCRGCGYLVTCCDSV